MKAIRKITPQIRRFFSTVNTTTECKNYNIKNYFLLCEYS